MNSERRRWVWFSVSYLLLWPVILAGSWPWSLADRCGLVIHALAGAWVVMHGVIAVKA